MNDTTFQGNGKIAYVPVVVDAKPKPITNAMKIRAMTDAELAIEMTAKGGCPHDCEEPENMNTDCVKCWHKWLRQAAEEGE